MPDYDFFELTGVSLEEESEQAVKSAITRKDRELGEAMSTSDQDKRREAEAQRKFLKDKREEMFGAGAKFKPVFIAMVKARVAFLKKRLDARVKIEAAARSVHTVTTGRLKSIRNNTAVSGGLPLEEIRAVYEANGFTVEESSAQAKLPKYPTNIEKIYSELEKFRAKAKDAESVTDLYAFVAYISDDIASAASYRRYPASRLKSVCEDYQRKYTLLEDGTAEKLAANIAGLAASHVFDSEEHRKSYDLYILYKSPNLQELFTCMRELDDADKRDPEIADFCIKTITAVFGDSDIALALYNSEARIVNNPYVPSNPVFTVRCAHCRTVCEFRSVAEARKLNRCTNCGEKLYKQCPRGHYVLLDADTCPDCGHVFPEAMLAECRRDFASVASAPQVQKVNMCLDILTRCADFKPAQDFLSQTPPLPCASLSASADDENVAVSLTWRPTGEHGVKYTLVRRKGNRAPSAPDDGEVILRGSLELSYRDKNLESGADYSYSVFVLRSRLYSPPASANVSVLSVVSSVQHTQSGNTLRLLWTQPKNCSGVRVVCQAGNEASVVLARSAMNSITVDNVKFGKRYSFSLTVCYVWETGKSRTVRYDVIPTPEIRPFTISAARVSDNVYRLSWSIIEGGADIQILSGDEVMGSARSEMRSCQLRLQPDRYYVLRGAVSSGGKTLYSSNNVEISTFSACTVDASRTEVTEEPAPSGATSTVHITLAVSMRRRPSLKKLVYFVRTDGTWASERDVFSQASALQTVSAESVLNSGTLKIDFGVGADDSFNITLFAVYEAEGREVVSAPCRTTVNRPLNANVFCSVSRSWFKNVQFSVRGEANRPVRRWPGFVVCVSSDGRPLVNYTDSNAEAVLEAEPVTPPKPSKHIEQTFEITRKLPKGTRLYLFWRDLRPGENFVFRYDRGFNGTV